MTFTVQFLHKQLRADLLVWKLIYASDKLGANFSKTLFFDLDTEILQKEFSEAYVKRLKVTILDESKLNKGYWSNYRLPILWRRYDMHVAKVLVVA